MSVRAPKKQDDEWEDISTDDEWEDVDTDEFPVAASKPSLLRRAYEFGTTPLTDAPSRFARNISQDWDLPTKEGNVHPLAAFGKGAIEGAGDLLSSMTNPIDLGATIATLGAEGALKAGLTPVAKGLRYIGGLLSAPAAYHGGETVLDPEKTLGEKAFGVAELAGGLAGTSQLFEPKISPTKPKPRLTPDNTTISKAKAEPVPEPIVPDAAARALEKQYDTPTKTPEQIAADEALLNKLFPNLEKSNRFKMSGEGMETSYPTRKESMAREQRSAEDRGAKYRINKFMEDEEGSFDPEFLSRRFPGDESVDLGEVPSREIDLEQAALEAGSDTAKPVFGRRGVAEFNPDTRRTLTAEADTPDLERYFQLRDVYRKLGDNMPEEQMLEWASIHNRLKNTKIEEPITVSPYKNERFPQEEPEFTTYILPDGRRVALSTSATKGAPTTSFTLKGGEVVEATKAPSGTSAFGNPIRRFMEDESGEFNPGAIFREPQSPLEVEHAFDWPGMGKEGAAEPMFHVRGGPEDRSTLSASTLRDRGMRLPEQSLNEFSPDLAQFNESVGQFGPDAVSPRFTERGSPEFDQARMNELFDKGTAGTLTGDELAEAKILYKKLNPQNFRPEPILESAPEPSFMDSINNFLADESGEVRFDQPQEQKIPFGRLPGEEQLAPNLPVQKRAIPEEKPTSMARQVWDLPRGTMSVDLPFMTSAAFRQASPLAWTKGWFESWAKSAKAFSSEQAYKTIMDDINKSEFFKPRYKPAYDAKGNLKGYKEMPGIAEDVGLKMSDMSHLSAREEQIRGSLAERIPGWGKYIKASNRAYTAFLNSTRKAQFENLMKQAAFTGGENDMVLAKQIAEFINNATGRSALKFKVAGKEFNFEKNAETLANGLWSPRLLASRMKMIGTPMSYSGLDPMVRQEYIKGLLRSAVTWGGFAGLASMAGAKVSLDPTNSDFGKIRIGNTRIDPGAGFQQLLVFAARMAPESQHTGKFTSSVTGKTQKYGQGFKGKTRADVAEEFAASKLHPSLKLAWDLLQATKDRPVHLGDRAVQMALPMMAQDIAEVMKGNPDLAIGMAPLSSVGFGTSTYGSGDSMSDPVFTDSIEQFLGAPKKSLRGTIKGF